VRTACLWRSIGTTFLRLSSPFLIF
jgi:hypothetical protein